MEKFKAVEKAMKTKAYSKEGLSATQRLDPKEQAKVEVSESLSGMVDELEQQIETLEAESESIQATMKKGKNQSAKAERMAEIDEIIERHKWHQGKLELIRRALENGGVDADQVKEIEDNIKYYVSDGMTEDYIHDEEMYDELALEEEEGAFGNQDNDEASSQDNQSLPDTAPEPEPIKPPQPKKVQKEVETAKKSTAQTKSPLPALATLHTPLATISSSTSSSMKPASIPTRPAGEGLKYASAAAAAAASEKSNAGLAPLPPPPGSAVPGISPLPAAATSKSSATSSPAVTSAQPAAVQEPRQVQPQPAPVAEPEPAPAPVPARASKKSKAAAAKQAALASAAPASSSKTAAKAAAAEKKEEESIYHLPASLQDLVESYEIAKKNPPSQMAPATMRLMAASQANCPDQLDAEVPRTYRPDMPVPPSSSGFPRDPLPIFDDPRLYSRIDPDTLFYVFYYKQGTAQQYLAAKALKDQSWRFHKQYQTWFQRHEEPKSITEEFEQGTYRFFDYESTW